MYDSLLRLWKAGKLSEALLDIAVTNGWITAEQKSEIMAL